MYYRSENYGNDNFVLIYFICTLTQKISECQFCLMYLNQQFHSNRSKCMDLMWIKRPHLERVTLVRKATQTLLGCLEFGDGKAHINCCTIERIH